MTDRCDHCTNEVWKASLCFAHWHATNQKLVTMGEVRQAKRDYMRQHRRKLNQINPPQQYYMGPAEKAYLKDKDKPA